jgi:hypothetical protein
MIRTDDTSNSSSPSRSTSEARRWRRRFRVASVGATVAGVTVFGSLVLTAHESSAAPMAGAAMAPARIAADNPPTTTPPAEMPQDMPGMDMSVSSPAPTTEMPQDMPGMDMPGDSHGHGDATGASSNRPLAPVLGTFGGATSAVLLTAGMLRRKDRAADLAKRAARLAGRGKK